MQNSRNTCIHMQQNIFALKALFYIQQLYIYAASRDCTYFNFKEIIYLLTVKEINSFKGHIFFHKKYNHSRQLYSLTELCSFQGNIFIQGKHIQGNYIHSRKCIHSQNIYSFKFRAICSFKKTMFNQQRYVRGHIEISIQKLSTATVYDNYKL